MSDWPDHLDWEKDGVRAVIYQGRLSIYGKPSMTADDGTVALGIDLPEQESTQGKGEQE